MRPSCGIRWLRHSWLQLPCVDLRCLTLVSSQRFNHVCTVTIPYRAGRSPPGRKGPVRPRHATDIHRDGSARVRLRPRARPAPCTSFHRRARTASGRADRDSGRRLSPCIHSAFRHCLSPSSQPPASRVGAACADPSTCPAAVMIDGFPNRFPPTAQPAWTFKRRMVDIADLPNGSAQISVASTNRHAQSSP